MQKGQLNSADPTSPLLHLLHFLFGFKHVGRYLKITYQQNLDAGNLRSDLPLFQVTLISNLKYYEQLLMTFQTCLLNPELHFIQEL